MANNPKTDRRTFLKWACQAGLIVAAPTIIPARALGLDGHVSPSNRINLAVIGLGNGWPMFLPNQDVQYVAICDVQKAERDLALPRIEARQGKGTCDTYTDFREVLARDDVDAVYIATPDHWHAVITIAAAKAGKHIFCQKPLTRTIAEGQAVVDAIHRHGIIFQHGTQQRHDERMLFGLELVLNGYIGELKQVKMGSPSGLTCPPQPPQPVPPGVDWDMWLGPAPWAPFTPLRIQSHPWYHISDYSMGYFAGWGVHHCDTAMQGSGLDNYSQPVELETVAMYPEDGLYDNPYRWQMHYQFANGVKWYWTDCAAEGWGSVAGPDWPQNRMGITFEGTEGTVFVWRNRVEATPDKLLRVQIGAHDKIRLRANLPGDWIKCIREGRQTDAPIEIAHRGTTLCSIAAISMKLGRKVTWDPVKEEFQSDDQANLLRRRPMRGNWDV